MNEIDFKNKTINNIKYNTIDIWINGISINNISKIYKIKTCYEKYDLIAFITSNNTEHHILKKSLLELFGTFYDKNLNQLSYDEIDIKNKLLKQYEDLKELQI